jgi:hypothetical protein
MKQMNVVKAKYLITGLALAGAALAQSAQASLANTGVDVLGGVDSNWNVSSTLGSGPASLATPSNVWPFSPNGPWVADDTTSSWITYSSPLDLNAPAATYTYTENFTLMSAETLAVRFLSDNESTLSYLENGNQTIIAAKGSPYDTSTFSMWSPYYDINLSSGNYTFQIVVNNDFSSDVNGNPTGVRFEEYEVVSPVPEPASLVTGVLVLIPLCIGLLRGMRKEGGSLKAV